MTVKLTVSSKHKRTQVIHNFLYTRKLEEKNGKDKGKYKGKYKERKKNQKS